MKLKDATKLGEAVDGTTGSSTYRVVALGDAIKIAARITSQYAVSVRVECASAATMDALSGIFEKAGLNVKTYDTGSIASVHVSGHDRLGAARVVGSVVYALGHFLNSAVLNIDALIVGGE